MTYAPLWCKSNFSFLEGASHAEELVEEAHRLGIGSLAITDRDGVYGMVRAHVKAKELGVQLVCGAQLTVTSARLASSPVTVGLHGGHGPGWGLETDDLPPAIPVTGRRGRTKRAKPRRPLEAVTSDLISAASGQPALEPPSQTSSVVLLAIDRAGWANLMRLCTAGRRRCDKGESIVGWDEICERAGGLIALAVDAEMGDAPVGRLREAFGDRLYAVLARHRLADDVAREARTRALGLPLVAATEVLYHSRARRPLQDVLTCIRHGVTLTTAGRLIRGNDEHDLRAPHAFARLYADEPAAVARTRELAARCTFSLGELRYRYPSERLPDGTTSGAYLRELAFRGAAWRYGGSEQAPREEPQASRRERAEYSEQAPREEPQAPRRERAEYSEQAPREEPQAPRRERAEYSERAPREEPQAPRRASGIQCPGRRPRAARRRARRDRRARLPRLLPHDVRDRVVLPAPPDHVPRPRICCEFWRCASAWGSPRSTRCGWAFCSSGSCRASAPSRPTSISTSSTSGARRSSSTSTRSTAATTPRWCAT